MKKSKVKEKVIDVAHIGSTWIDYPSPDGIATIVYFTGCEHYCEGCQNIELINTNFKKGTKFSISNLMDVLNINVIKNRSLKIVLSGGDPLHPKNIEFAKQLLENKVYDFCIYTGYNIEYVKHNDITNFKYIIVNKFDKTKQVPSQKTDEFFQLASTNQEIYNKDFELISKEGKLIFKENKNV